MERFLVSTLLTAEGIKPLSLVEIDDGEAVVSPFEKETSSTIFLTSPAALLREDSVTDFLLDDIAAAMAQFPREAALQRLHNLFLASGLYYKTGKGASLLPLV